MMPVFRTSSSIPRPEPSVTQEDPSEQGAPPGILLFGFLTIPLLILYNNLMQIQLYAINLLLEDIMEHYRLKILRIVKEQPHTRTYHLEKPHGFHWAEGAHAHFAFPADDAATSAAPTLVRHMSIMTLPEEHTIGFTTRLRPDSPFKQRLFHRPVGEDLLLFKPGSRMTLQRRQRPVVLLSMGVGMATMRPLILAHHRDGTGIPLLVNLHVDSADHPLYRKTLDSLTSPSYMNHWVRSRRDFYERLHTLHPLSPLYYVVGSDAFLLEVLRLLLREGVPLSDIITDKKELFLKKLLSIPPGEFKLLL